VRGHATCAGITAVRRSPFGHQEVSGTQVSTECEAMLSILPDSTVSGGFWEETNAKAKVKVKVKVKVKANVNMTVKFHVVWALSKSPNFLSLAEGEV
jgi:hypothetical protein